MNSAVFQNGDLRVVSLQELGVNGPFCNHLSEQSMIVESPNTQIRSFSILI